LKTKEIDPMDPTLEMFLRDVLASPVTALHETARDELKVSNALETSTIAPHAVQREEVSAT
jgi:hypothetical protein